MMTEPAIEQNYFSAALEKIYLEGQGENDPLQKVKSRAWDHFLELGLPTRKTEVFRYIKLKSLYAQAFQSPSSSDINPQNLNSSIYPECQQSLLVFVNGFFKPELSRLEALPKKMVICPLTEAMRTYGALLNNQWAKGMKEETDPFAALNAALHQEGLFIYLPPRTIVETPLQILHIIDVQETPALLSPRLHLFAGAQSEVDIYSNKMILSGNKHWTNQVGDFTLEEGAHVRLTQVASKETPDSWHFEATRAFLKRDSRFKTLSITNGSKTVRNDYKAQLSGENGEALLNGLWMLGQTNEAHIHILMEHQAPACRSMQLYKGVLDGASCSSFEGKILVRQAAQKTEAFQLNNNLLVSERAHADSKPNLEIFADDVKASHGATVGQLDEEQMFYMKTRGFSDSQAKNMLVHGFCEEVLAMVMLPSLRDELHQQAKNYMLG